MLARLSCLLIALVAFWGTIGPGNSHAASPATLLRRQAEEIKRLNSFVNGHSSPASEAAFESAVRRYGRSPGVQPILSREIPRLDGAANFRCTAAVFDVLQSDGTLTAPPQTLAGSGRGDRRGCPPWECME